MATTKPLIWMGTSKRDLGLLGPDQEAEIGYALYHVQLGRVPGNAKVLTGFGGAGVQEIRTGDSAGTYRCVYAVHFSDAIYVLHVFQKKSKSGIATPKADLDLVRERLRQATVLHQRRQKGNG